MKLSELKVGVFLYREIIAQIQIFQAIQIIVVVGVRYIKQAISYRWVKGVCDPRWEELML